MEISDGKNYDIRNKSFLPWAYQKTGHKTGKKNPSKLEDRSAEISRTTKNKKRVKTDRSSKSFGTVRIIDFPYESMQNRR